MKTLFGMLALAVGLSLDSPPANAQTLINGGFEMTDRLYTNVTDQANVTAAASGWTQFFNGLRISTNETANSLTAHNGSYSLKCFGSTNWDGEGAYQIISDGVITGKTYVLNGYGLILSSDPLTNTSTTDPQPFGFLQITFNNGNKPLSRSRTDARLNSSNGLNKWLSVVVTATAPQDATQIHVYAMELGFGRGCSGSIYWDDISLSVLP